MAASVRYMVEDVDEAVEFYTELLGFELVEQFGPAMAILSRDDLRLWAAGPRSSAAREMPDGAKPEPGGWNRFVITVDDIKAMVAALKSANAIFRNEIISGPGGKQTLVEDPSGNPIEIFEPQGLRKSVPGASPAGRWNPCKHAERQPVRELPRQLARAF